MVGKLRSFVVLLLLLSSTFAMPGSNCGSNPCGSFSSCTSGSGMAFTCTCNNGYNTTSGQMVNYSVGDTVLPCTDINECLTNQCDPNAVCVDSTTAGSGVAVLQFKCTCDAGYWYSDKSQAKTYNNGDTTAMCVIKPECMVSNCNSNAACTDYTTDNTIAIGSFQCTCAMFYQYADMSTQKTFTEGSTAMTCGLANLCSPNPCVAQQTCADRNTVGSIPVGSFRCTCNNGYWFSDMSLAKTYTFGTSPASCVVTPECMNSNNCGTQGVCSDNTGDSSVPIGSFKCTCNTYYVYSDQSTAKTYASGATAANCQLKGQCSPSPCNSNANCNDRLTVGSIPVGSYRCTCVAGYWYADMSVQKTYMVGMSAATCQLTPTCTTNTCKANSVCADPTTDGTVPANNFKCTCNMFYQYSDGTTAKTYTSGQGPATCQVGGVCSANPCKAQQTCKDTTVDITILVGFYTCTCGSGYYYSDMSTTKTYMVGNTPASCVLIPICATNNCSPNAVCTDPTTDGTITANNYKCTCNTYYQFSDGSTAKTYMNMQAAGTCGVKPQCMPTNPCKPQSTCTDNTVTPMVPVGSYRCACNLGYQYSDMSLVQTYMVGSSSNACALIPICASNNCNSNAVCTDPTTDATVPADNYKCTCNTYYQFSDGSKTKTYPNGTAASTCQVAGQCSPDPCSTQSSCADNTVAPTIPVGSVQCSCNAGYAYSDTTTVKTYMVGVMTDTCNDINECATLGPCAMFSTCSESTSDATIPANEFKCSCLNGYNYPGGSLANTYTVGQMVGKCVLIQECSTNSCSLNSTCTDPTTDVTITPGSYRCTCSAGFSYSDTTLVKTYPAGTGAGTCFLQNQCSIKNICQANAVCADFTTNPAVTVGTYQCTCNPGWAYADATTLKSFPAGSMSQVCLDINECNTLSPCTPQSTCSESTTNATIAPNQFKCSCDNGYYFMPGVGYVTYTVGQTVGTCVLIPECNFNLCSVNATCQDPTTNAAIAAGNFQCTCNQYHVYSDQSSVQTYAAGVTAADCGVQDECLTNMCSGSATCAAANVDPTIPLGSYRCTCDKGAFYPDKSTVQTYLTGSPPQFCDLYDCMVSVCDATAACQDHISNPTIPMGYFMCHCVTLGWLEPGGTPNKTYKLGVVGEPCYDRNECIPNPCNPFSNCTDSTNNPLVAYNRFRCTCSAGYNYPSDGSTMQDYDYNSTGVEDCERNICASNPCGPSAACADAITTKGAIPPDQYVCTCVTNGFAYDDGTNTRNFTYGNTPPPCLDRNECNYNMCDALSTCSDSTTNPKVPLNQFACTCVAGANFSPGLTVQMWNNLASPATVVPCTDINECLADPCMVSTGLATCADSTSTGSIPLNQFQCSCVFGAYTMIGHNMTNTYTEGDTVDFCIDINECTDPTLNLCFTSPPLPNMICSSQLPTVPLGEMLCSCPLGYLVSTNDTRPVTLMAGDTFPGCTQVSYCSSLGCLGVGVCTDGINNRTCFCPPGSWQNGQSEFIVGPVNATLNCDDINECEVYGCGTFLGKNITCNNGPGLNKRTCACPDFLSGSNALVGNAEFSGCVVLVDVKNSITLGYTLDNGFWNDWAAEMVYDLNGDGVSDFWFSTLTRGDIAWLEGSLQTPTSPYTFSRRIIHTGSVEANPVRCQSPTAFSTPGSPLRVVCIDENGNLVAYTFNEKSNNFPDIPKSNFLNAPYGNAVGQLVDNPLYDTASGDFDMDGLPDFMISDETPLGTGQRALQLYLSNKGGIGRKVPLYIAGLAEDVVMVKPLFVDFTGDNLPDLIFSDPSKKTVYWYALTNFSSVSVDFQLTGSLKTNSTPWGAIVDNLNTVPGLDMVVTGSNCYTMYIIFEFANISVADPVSTLAFDGYCDSCGCGSSYGVISNDIDHDGDEDLINFLTGGVEILLNTGEGKYVPQKVLGGADTGILFDMNNDGQLDIVCIATGISLWYQLGPPDACALGTDNCEGYEVCQSIGWTKPGFLCNCDTAGYERNATGYCVDIDECSFTPSVCDQNCTNFPGGYRCECGTGYYLVGNRTCVDRNECQETIGICQQVCVDTVGSYYCTCDKGYQTDPVTPRNCIDIDECSTSFPCDHICQNLVPGYSCSCYKGFEPTLDNPDSCVQVPCVWDSWSSWASCICGGESVRQRQPNQLSLGSLQCNASSDSEAEFCDILSTCYDRNRPASDLEEALVLLRTAYSDLYFKYMWPELVPVTVKIDTENGLITFFTPCNDTLALKNATDSIQTEIAYLLGQLKQRSVVKFTINPYDSIPVVGTKTSKRSVLSNSTFVNGLQFDISGVYPADKRWLMYGVPFGILAVLGFALGLYLFMRRMKINALSRDMRMLPKMTTVHYRNAILKPNEWTQVGDNPPLFKKLLTSEKDKAFVLNIFELLDGGGLGVKEIWAVYNPMLVSSLALTKEKFANRAENSANIFGKESWRENKNESERRVAKRLWTKGFLEKKIFLFPWNTFSSVPILATVHGTAGANAWKICQGGFAALSSLDSGYYGAGIYFTTSAKYALPYYATKPDPSIIISWVLPGNAYPVIEHPRKNGNLAGTIIKPGYQSHYVCTNNKGMPFPTPDASYSGVYDEIVINQEAQVAPAYVLVLDNTTFPKLIVAFNRSVPSGGKDELNSSDEEERTRPADEENVELEDSALLNRPSKPAFNYSPAPQMTASTGYQLPTMQSLRTNHYEMV